MYFRKNKKTISNLVSGFTLIELLVVISLMALLSFIVLSSLDSAREKGMESSVQSVFSSIRAQTERYYSRYNTFNDLYNNEIGNLNVCQASSKNYGLGNIEGPGYLRDLEDLTSKVDAGHNNITPETAGAWDKVTCHASNDAWVIEAPMSDSTPEIPRMYCIDSTSGIMKELINSNIGGEGASNQYSCTSVQ